MGQNNSKSSDKQTELPQINFLTLGSGSGLSIPTQRHSPDSSQISKEPTWNTIFRWPFGGEHVEITGSFTNWENSIPLAKVGNEFNIILNLPAGVHKYKFIVDGEWKFSLLDPSCLDESGNVNNILDTTHYNPRVSNTISLGSGSNESSGSGLPTSRILNQNKRSENHKFSALKKEDNKMMIEFNENEFEQHAEITPPHLLDIYFCNEKDERIRDVWKKNETNNNEKTASEGIFRAFESFNSIPPPTHVVLNHIGMSKDDVGDDSLCFVLTERFKGKYATIKFYTTC